MNQTLQSDTFHALVRGEVDFIKTMPPDVDFNEYYQFDVPDSRVTLRKVCMCNVEFELFRGSTERMMTLYGDVIKNRKCDHCEGQPKAPQSRQDRLNLNHETLDSEYSFYAQYLPLDEEKHDYFGGLNALQIAAIFGHTSLAEWLINARGCIVNSVTKYMRETTLTLAVRRGHLDIVELLLRSGAQLDFYSEVLNNCPVFYAVENNDLDMLQLLIKEGAEVSHVGTFGEKPIGSAMTCQNVQCLAILLKAGAETRKVSTDTGLLLKDALCCQEKPELAELLVNYIDVNEHHTFRGKIYTPLFSVVAKGYGHFAKALVQRGAKLDTNIGQGNSVLHWAVFYNKVDMTELLIDLGCSLNLKNDLESTPLHIAARKGHFEICKILLEKGAEIDLQNKSMQTPLSSACRGDHLSVIELLLSAGPCNVNNEDKHLVTPLLHSAYHGNVQASCLLVARGADPGKADVHGTTPVWNAVFSKSQELVRYFIRCNVNLDVPSTGIDLRHYRRGGGDSKIYDEPASLLFVACDSLLPSVPTWLVLAGVDLTKEVWTREPEEFPEELLREELTDDAEAVRDELTQLTRGVRSLQEASRITIHRLVRGNNLEGFARKLEISVILQEYLCFKDF